MIGGEEMLAELKAYQDYHIFSCDRRPKSLIDMVDSARKMENIHCLAPEGGASPYLQPRHGIGHTAYE